MIISKLRLTVTSVAIAFTLCSAVVFAAEAPSEQHDLWIKGGIVVDGDGGAPRRADVVARADRIVYVGPPRQFQARQVIDATGKVVAPGFIDTHAHGDPLEEGSFKNFALQGVTSVVLGQDGRTPGYASEHGTDEDVPPGGRKTLEQWLQAVAKLPLQTNVASLVGHGTLRLQAGVGISPEVTPAQLQTIRAILQQGLRAGAYGISSGLEYVPGRFAGTAELKALAEVVGREGGVVMSHMRSEDEDRIGAAIDELIAQADHARVHVSHLKVVFARSPQDGSRVLTQLDGARARGVAITADVYPYLAGYGDLSLLYPPWAKTRDAWNQVLASDRAKLEAYLRERIERRGGAGAILLADAPYADKTLAKVAAELQLPAEKVVMDVMGFGGPNAAHFIMRADVQDQLICWSHAAIGTDGGPWIRHPRSWGTYPKVLQEHVRERKLMTLEQAVHKMTGLPAQIAGFTERGRIADGYYADLVVFDPKTIRSEATWDHPDRPPAGIDQVIVNGCVQVAGGRLTANHCGRVLRRQPQAKLR